MDRVHVSTYSPTTEYGGWGMGGIGDRDKAYIVKGDTGIQVIMKDGGKFLISTMKPKEAQETLQSHIKTAATYDT